jgi:hypothetical protein
MKAQHGQCAENVLLDKLFEVVLSVFRIFNASPLLEVVYTRNTWCEIAEGKEKEA